MRGTVAKRLRHQALIVTVGKEPRVSRALYKHLKKEYLKAKRSST